MKNKFKEYLIEKGLTTRSIHRKQREISHYLTWLEKQNIPITQSTYSDLMCFIGHWQDLDKSVHQINRCLQAISDFYQFLQIPDVAYRVRVRGIIQRAPGPQFTAEQLDLIYQHFTPTPDHGYYHFSDKIILGMMIYQALELHSFLHIRIQGVDLDKGMLYVPAHSHRQARYIPLAAHQILPLHQYLQHRDQIIHTWKKRKHYLPAENKIISDKLFSPQCERYPRLHIQYKRLSKRVKQQAKEKLDLDILKLSQLRQSRISLWIPQYGLRKTQYLAGLKSVDSIERYQKLNLKNLKEQLQKHHPLK